MRPLSFQEKKNISNLFENIGFHKDLSPQNNERYSFINDSIISITNKTPVSIGVKLNIPFEAVSFYNSFFFHPRIMNDQMLEMINFMATNLLHISENMVIEHEFPINEKRYALLDILNKFMPEGFSSENERQWITRIRVSLMNKYEIFQKYESKFYDELAVALKSIGLEPTWELPSSLKDGIPRIRRESTLFFSNPEGNEYFIAEKGFLTFLRDIQVNNVQLRVFFESYTPLLLEAIFNDVPNFSVKDLILSWVRYSRMSLNPLINVLSSEYILAREFYPINLESLFQNESGDIGDSAIPLPAIARERLAKEDLFKPAKKLFNNPPTSFNELSAISQYEEAGNLVKKGKLQDAIKILAKLLVTLNRYRQTLGVIKVLFKLSDIGSDLKKYDQSISYLKNALNICKTGKIPIDLIVQTHDKLGDLYYKNKQYDLAIDHYKVIINFLKSQETEENIRDIQIIRLKISKVLVETEQYKDVSLLFKKIAQDGGKFPEVLAKLYLERARYFIKKESVSNAIQLLKKACLIENASKKQLGLCHFELGKLYLYERNNGSKAAAQLLAADKLIDDNKNEDLFLKVTLYETLADAFNNTKEFDSMKFYMDRARQIVKVLQVRGLY